MATLDAGVLRKIRSGPAPAAALAPRGRGRRRLGPGTPIPFGFALGPGLLVGAWVLGSATGAIDPETLPAPWTVAQTAGDLIADGRLQSNLLTSLQRAAFGLGLGVAIGVVLALVAGLSRLGEAIVDGPVQIKRAIPTLALIPLFIVWFGIGEEMKLIVITTSVLIPVYINTHAYLRSVDARYVELAETVGLSRWGFLRRIALPGSLPGFFLGLRLAVTISWLALVVVEQVNATSGIGYLMTQARTYGQIDVIVVGLVIYGLLGLFGDLAVRAAERKALAWRQTLGD
ncbi:ABC transporter permease [Nocardia asteroides]|uniref:Aliphatic sulfonate ABC transporter permease protein n=1 Tax=Nocardia asteroides NBRC 15531 TaxID=1110697 RepID=U5EIP4_NOCAS|nr:ABC transporter permease [Nocardia asteroides]TLF62939.1 ABC transporter permease [Nocardia asteroides NBRC 15531]UGT46613.1 ABC transporter permease [Nocardia asteroides]SFN51052.1 sulfonate transport system permease protein [Nocardia asteroides]VEG34551.1 Putative aliphatic sulfonates transport permease protein ssuC [Nocardia asteroides]GAD85029.1 aliphatic sulfonate ABC transporter permease protein [Nocardia asteroides NBRC 15531]